MTRGYSFCENIYYLEKSNFQHLKMLYLINCSKIPGCWCQCNWRWNLRKAFCGRHFASCAFWDA